MRWLMGLAVALTPAFASAASGDCFSAIDFGMALEILDGTLIFEGPSDQGHLTQLYVFPDSDRWLAAIVYEDGTVCYVDMGALPTLGEAL